MINTQQSLYLPEIYHTMREVKRVNVENLINCFVLSTNHLFCESNIPLERAQESAKILQDLGADITF